MTAVPMPRVSATAAARRLATRAHASLLGAGGVYLALFIVVHAVLAFSSTGCTPVTVADLLLIGGTAALVTLRRVVTRRTAVLIVAALILAALIGSASLPPAPASSGYPAWFFGAITLVALGLALRGHRLATWITYVGMSSVAIGWGLVTGQGALAGVQLIDRHFATLLVGTVFTIALERYSRRERAFQALEHRERAADQAAEIRESARRAAARGVLEQAGPMLGAIAAGRLFSADDRRELLVIEGSLRDQIRAPNLLSPAVRDSVARARRRGVNVLLLDEAAATTPAALERATRWLAQQLDTVEDGGFVGRLRASATELRVTAVAGDRSRSTSVPLGESSESGGVGDDRTRESVSTPRQ